jgi:hypothetical protein
MCFSARMAFAALLLGSTIATSTMAQGTASVGCPPGAQRAEAEGGGVGSETLRTRKAEAEGGGVGSENVRTRKAEAEAPNPCR